MAWPADSAAAPLALLSMCLAILPAARTVTSARLGRLVPPITRLGPGEGAAGGAGPGRAHSGATADAGDDPADADTSRAGTGAVRAMVFSIIGGAGVVATFPSVGGGFAALLVSAACYLLLRGLFSLNANSRTGGRLAALRPGAGLGRAARADPELPFAIDLLAVCLRAGMPTSTALRAVGNVLSGEGSAGRRATGQGLPGAAVVLSRVAAATELGSESATAWQDWIGHPVYGRLARALVVTGESGSAVAGRLEAVSQLMRTAAGQQSMERGQRVGVALMAPLGLCFLPAFVCLGVVPVVVGIAGQVFG
ncbi:MAG: type II secretion system F family protein [Actinomycetota bacterium]|nr:type II secretion system F family protein [Actinomycetota bacterium]